MESEAIGIHSLPDEIIIMIMKYSSYSDCNSLMRTCKRYNDLLKSSHSLWRFIYKKMAGKEMYNITAAHSEGNWTSDMKQYLSLRRSIIDIILAMSPKHFSKSAIIGLETVKEIFSIALSSNTNYYCTISIIQNHIREANKKIDTYRTKSPYTLTEIYYGKTLLRYLMHVILCVKWVQNEAADLLTPDRVLNFISQWIDPLNMHTDEEVQELLKGMICDVDRALLVKNDGAPLPDGKTNRTGVNGIYSEKEVLLAISHYMYKQRRMLKNVAFNEDTLDIVKTINTNSGHAICFGAIFLAIARGFGITTCELMVFSDHSFVEWRYNNGFGTEKMKFSLDNGELMPLVRCRFADIDMEAYHLQYQADKFARYIVGCYVDSMESYIKSWRSNNASQLSHFLTNVHYSEYYNFIYYVRELDHNKLAIPFNMEYMHDEHLNCIHGLLTLNRTPSFTSPNYKIIIKHRESEVMYCVGLICFNKRRDYVCVIQHWDRKMQQDFRSNLDLDSTTHLCDQPHYRVIATDQSERYIAQDNLEVVTSPSRLYHLEEILGKEFSHFNGFFYVPNTQKQFRYPDDINVGNAFAARRKLITHVRLY